MNITNIILYIFYNTSHNINHNMTHNINHNITHNMTHNTSNNTSNNNSNKVSYIEIYIAVFCTSIFMLVFFHQLTTGFQGINAYNCKKIKKFFNNITFRVRDLYDEDEDEDQYYGPYEYYGEFNITEETINKKEIPIKNILTFSNINKYPIFCSICQENTLNTVKIDCNDHFCKECITEYIKTSNNCPNCKQDINNIYEINVLNMEIV